MLHLFGLKDLQYRQNDLNKFYGSPNWIVFGVNGRYIVSDKFSVQARLDNILDEHYIEFASGVSSPGRNLSISFTADF